MLGKYPSVSSATLSYPIVRRPFLIRFLRVFLGHFDKVFDVDGWDYHKRLAATCTTSAMRIRLRLTYGPTDGSVIKLRGAFGTKALFVYDPKALYHIFITDQHVFEETRGFSM